MSAVIDPDKLAELRMLGGDALVSQLLARFLESSPALLAQAETALQAGDASGVAFCVHTLKGSAMSLGISEMSTVLAELNVRAKAGKLDGVSSDLAHLAELLEAVRQYKTQNFP